MIGAIYCKLTRLTMVLVVQSCSFLMGSSCRTVKTLSRPHVSSLLHGCKLESNNEFSAYITLACIEINFDELIKEFEVV